MSELLSLVRDTILRRDHYHHHRIAGSSLVVLEFGGLYLSSSISQLPSLPLYHFLD